MLPVLRLSTYVAALSVAGIGAAQGRLVVDAAHPGITISPTFYGLMTEEINHAYDGGLYAEVIANRSFFDSSHWGEISRGRSVASFHVDVDRHVGLLHVDSVKGGGRSGIHNDGYWGIPVMPNSVYHARVDLDAGPAPAGGLDFVIGADDGNTVFAHARIANILPGSHRYEVDLRTGNVPPSTTNQFVVYVDHPGDYTFHFASLFPPTYEHQPNGFRTDLMQLLAGMHPAFLRLPGGNYLEGNTISERFQWNATVGDIATRPGHQGPWGYRSTDGLGLLEFLRWCDDLHMQPVLAVYAGYSLGGEHVDAGRNLDGYVADAIREIEFVTGARTSDAGFLRATLGHPAPFPLTYVEIGNEDMFDRSGSYEGRFAQFYDAIKARWPQLKVIATMPVHSRTPDVIDDHYYRSAADMARDAGHYDHYPRGGPKIFVGEWASTEGHPTPTLQAALGDAAWLTGLERNSDLVVMEAYAPLLVNVNPGAAQWGTNLIGYDALTSFGSPSYYVQSMFAANRGDVVLPVTVDVPAPPAPPFVPHGGIGLGTWRTSAVYRNISVTDGDERLFPKAVGEGAAGWTPVRGKWTLENESIGQSTLLPDTLATNGDPSWTNYTYRVQARKVSGAEGFLVQFHVHDGDYWQWNVGGWNDTRTAIQHVVDGDAQEVGPSSDVTVKPGHWYDIRIEVSNRRVRCFLDEQLVSEVVESPRRPVDPIFAEASRDRISGDVILKVVNVSGDSRPVTLEIGGAKVSGSLRGWQLSGRPEDMNSISQPTKIAPKEIRLPAAFSGMTVEFPPYSVTVFRLPTSG